MHIPILHASTLFQYQLPISGGVGLVGMICCLLYRLYKGKSIEHGELGYLTECFLAALAIAQSFFLVYCGFYPEYLKQVPEYPAYIIIAACIAMYLSAITIKKAFTADITPSTKKQN